MEPLSSEQVISALKTVYDPEIPVNIVDLGLVYDVAVDAAGAVGVKMTLTSPGCGLAGMIAMNAERSIREGLPGVTDVKVELVWEPRWTPERMSAEAKQKLGFM